MKSPSSSSSSFLQSTPPKLVVLLSIVLFSTLPLYFLRLLIQSSSHSKSLSQNSLSCLSTLQKTTSENLKSFRTIQLSTSTSRDIQPHDIVLQPTSTFLRQKTPTLKTFLVAIFLPSYDGNLCVARSAPHVTKRYTLRKWMRQQQLQFLSSSSKNSLFDYLFVLDPSSNPSTSMVESEKCTPEMRNRVIKELTDENEQFGDMLLVNLVNEDSERPLANRAKLTLRFIQYLGDYQNVFDDIFDRTENLPENFGENFGQKYKYIIKTNDEAVIKLEEYEQLLRREVEEPFLAREREEKRFVEPSLSSQDHATTNYRDLYLVDQLLAYSGNFTIGVVSQDPLLKQKTSLSVYPKFANGGTFVMSSFLGKSIYVASKLATLRHWENDDATFGHWASLFQHVKHDISPVFESMPVFSQEVVQSKAIVLHSIESPEALQSTVDALVRLRQAK